MWVKLHFPFYQTGKTTAEEHVQGEEEEEEENEEKEDEEEEGKTRGRMRRKKKRMRKKNSGGGCSSGSGGVGKKSLVWSVEICPLLAVYYESVNMMFLYWNNHVIRVVIWVRVCQHDVPVFK